MGMDTTADCSRIQAAIKAANGNLPSA